MCIRDRYDAIILAVAGLKRLGLKERIAQVIPHSVMLPAIAQGAIGIICRTDQVRVLNTVKSINDQATGVCVKIEREFLRLLEGGCTAPIGAFAQIDGDKILFEGGIFSLDGKKAITIQHQGRVSKASLMASKAVKEILSKGGDRLMETIRQ